MQITGVQPIGGSRYVSMQPVVVDDKPAIELQAGLDAGIDARQAAHLLDADPVVFPREGPRLDQRPDELKRRRAAEKYRQNESAAASARRRRRRR